MLKLKLFVLFLVSLLHFEYGKAYYCSSVFSKAPINLTEVLAKVKKEGTLALKAYKGKWIKVHNHSLRYLWLGGESGPLRVHFLGLGGELAKSISESKQLTEHIRQGGRLLAIELPGQGLTEVVSQLRAQKQQLMMTSSRRSISFEKNVELAYTAITKILEKNNESPQNVQFWSGNSFGGLIATGVKARYSTQGTTQLFAVAVASFESRFLPNKTNISIETWRKRVDYLLNIGTAIGLKLVRLFLGTQRVVDSKDAIKLDGATGQYFGARHIDAVKLAEQFSPKEKVQVFTGQMDMVVFPMMHYELIQALKTKGVETTSIIVEGANHNISKSMTHAQVKKIAEINSEFSLTSGFYWLTSKGELRPLTSESALAQFKEMSRRNWRLHEQTLSRIFRLLGHEVNYPTSWKE